MKDPLIPAFFATAILLLMLPWLNPLTYGPTSPVVQFLTVWIGAALCWWVCWVAGIKGAARAQLFAAAWLLAALVSASMGLLQYLGLAANFSPWLNYVEAGQAYANLRQRNQLATLLAIGLCALLWWQMRASAHAPRVGQAQELLKRWCFGLAATLLAMADAASASRTGMLQLVVLLALALLWKRGRGSMVLVLLAYALAAIALPRLAGLDPLHSGILGRLAEAASPCASRLTLWSNVLHLIAQKPWTGWGWGELAYAHLMTPYAGERFCEIMGNAHDLPLHLAVELGVPVAVLLGSALLALVLRARPWRERDATRQMAWSVLAVIGAHSLLEYPLWYAPFQLAALLAVWLLWQVPQSRVYVEHGAAPMAHAERASLSFARTAAAAPWIGVLACVLLLACSYAGWDYWRISQIYLAQSERAPAYREDTLEKIRPSWLFAKQVKFAELGITPLTADNADHVHALALEMLHFSPEASVVVKVIDSAALLGLGDEVEFYRQRLKAAYPQEYAEWRSRKKASGASDKAS